MKLHGSLCAVLLASHLSAQVVSVYEQDTTSLFTNPERGWAMSCNP